MNNTEAAQLLSVAIGSEALEEALRDLRIQSYSVTGVVVIHSASCPGFAPRWWRVAFCFYRHYVTYLNPARTARRYVSQATSQFAPAHGIDTAHRGLTAIDRMNRETVRRFPAVIAEIAQDYIRAARLNAAHVTAACQGLGECPRSSAQVRGMSLPVRSDSSQARLTMCNVMQFGSTVTHSTFRAKGFPLGRGPLRAGGAGSRPVLKDHINHSTQVGRNLERFYRYYRDLRMMRPGPDTPFPQIANFWLPQREPGPNQFTARFDAKFLHLCTGVGLIYRLRAPFPETYVPIGGSVLTPGASGPRSVPDAYRIVALTQRDRQRRVASQTLTDTPYGHFAYAQTNVFNPDGLSLFSQNWQFDLAPSSRLQRPSVVAQDLRRRTDQAFVPLADLLVQAGPAIQLGVTNAH